MEKFSNQSEVDNAKETKENQQKNPMNLQNPTKENPLKKDEERANGKDEEKAKGVLDLLTGGTTLTEAGLSNIIDNDTTNSDRGINVNDKILKKIKFPYRIIGLLRQLSSSGGKISMIASYGRSKAIDISTDNHNFSDYIMSVKGNGLFDPFVLNLGGILIDRKIAESWSNAANNPNSKELELDTREEKKIFRELKKNVEGYKFDSSVLNNDNFFNSKDPMDQTHFDYLRDNVSNSADIYKDECKNALKKYIEANGFEIKDDLWNDSRRAFTANTITGNDGSKIKSFNIKGDYLVSGQPLNIHMPQE